MIRAALAPYIEIIRAVAALLVLGGLAFGGWKVWDWRQRALAGEAQVDTLEGTAEATGDTLDNLGQAQAGVVADQTVITQARAAARAAIEEASRANPAVADWRAQPVPVELRAVARARREARERAAD